VLEADTSIAVYQVERRPVAVLEPSSRGEVVVQDNGIPHAKVVGGVAYVVELVLEPELRRMHTYPALVQ
jgi:hypothetical protein